MNQKQRLEIFKNNLREFDKEELIDILISITEISLAAVIANSKLNLQRLNNAVAEQNCSFQTVHEQQLNQNCVKIEQSLNEIIQNYKDEKAKRLKGN